jgi:hypothetical protein
VTLKSNYFLSLALFFLLERGSLNVIQRKWKTEVDIALIL